MFLLSPVRWFKTSQEIQSQEKLWKVTASNEDIWNDFPSWPPLNWLLTASAVNSPDFPRRPPCVTLNFPLVLRNVIRLADASGQGCIRMPCITTLSLLPSGRLSAIQTPFAFQPSFSKSRLSRRKGNFLQIGSWKIPNALNLWQNALNTGFLQIPSLIYADHLEKPFI